MSNQANNVPVPDLIRHLIEGAKTEFHFIGKRMVVFEIILANGFIVTSSQYTINENTEDAKAFAVNDAYSKLYCYECYRIKSDRPPAKKIERLTQELEFAESRLNGRLIIPLKVLEDKEKKIVNRLIDALKEYKRALVDAVDLERQDIKENELELQRMASREVDDEQELLRFEESVLSMNEEDANK